ETHLWLAPGYDSLTATWARRFEPLIEPADRLPADLRAQLVYPVETFKLAVAALVRASDDSAGQTGWLTRPGEPYRLGAPDGAVWTGITFETGLLAPRRLVGVLAGAIRSRGPELHLWRPSAPDPPRERLPGELVGSSLLPSRETPSLPPVSGKRSAISSGIRARVSSRSWISPRRDGTSSWSTGTARRSAMSWRATRSPPIRSSRCRLACW